MKGYAEASEEMRYDVTIVVSEWVSEWVWECESVQRESVTEWQSDNSPPKAPKAPNKACCLSHTSGRFEHLSFKFGLWGQEMGAN
jgi:hypothetical protein